MWVTEFKVEGEKEQKLADIPMGNRHNMSTNSIVKKETHKFSIGLELVKEKDLLPFFNIGLKHNIFSTSFIATCRLLWFEHG